MKIFSVLVFAGMILGTYFFGFHSGQQEAEYRWTVERERILRDQLAKIVQRDKEIAKLQTSIITLNDSAKRVRERDAAIQRRLQAQLGNCSRFKPALESCSATLSRCAEHAVSDRKIIEHCAVQLR